ncbi:MAG: metallophosphoesterase family protein [Bdellovibrionota bacterium]
MLRRLTFLATGLLFLIARAAIAGPAASPVLSFGIIADAGSWTDHSREVRNSLLKSGISHLILPGDNLYNTNETYDSVWSHWSKMGFQFSVVALGNHTGGYAKEMGYFAKPGEYYSVDSGPSQFLVLNSDNLTNVPAQMAWLEAALSASSAQFLFIVFHHPPVTLSSRHSWNEKAEFQEALLPILLRYQGKITGVLVGHDHLASLVDLGGIPLVVSGAVFESLSAPPVRNEQRRLNVETRWTYRGGYYWTRLDLNADTGEAWINFVRADHDEVSCSARIRPLPMLLRPNCAATGLALP